MQSIIRKSMLLSFVIALLAVTVSAQTQTAKKEWNKFWVKFTNAVKENDKGAIKTMAASDFFDGGGGDTISVWMKENLDRGGGWAKFYKILKKGTKIYKSDDKKPWRVTLDQQFLFVYKSKRWQFYGVMGD